jgi:hypothetical protein
MNLTLEAYGETHTLNIMKSAYADNGSLYLGLVEPNGEPFCNLTVNLDDHMAGDGLAYVDTNNAPFAEALIEKYHLGIKTPFIGQSGYCSYPMYAFDKKQVNKFLVKE